MLGRQSFSFLLFLCASAGAVGCIEVPSDLDSDGGGWVVPGDSSVPSQDAGASIGGGSPGGSTPTVDSGAGLGGSNPVPSADAGGQPGAQPEEDAALPTDDAEVPDPEIDAGAPSTDAGTPTTDAGTPTTDAGTPTTDAGAPSTDAGKPTTDAGAPTTDAGGPTAHCLDGITNYGSVGPFKYTTKTSGKVKFWVPNVPAGCKVPVVHLANGTLATCNDYLGALERLASHGFLAACYEDPRTGTGQMGVTAFETAFSQFPDLADKKLGSTGHSQGGQASLITTQLAEAKWGSSMIYAALAMQPASGYGEQPVGQTWQQSYAKIRAPVFMFSGNTGTGFLNSSLLPGVIPGRGDGLVGISWVQEGFDALNDSIEAYHWLADGSTHIPTPVAQEQEISIPWFRWKLLGDKAACAHFKKMKTGNSKWKVEKEQNPKPCE